MELQKPELKQRATRTPRTGQDMPEHMAAADKTVGTNTRDAAVSRETRPARRTMAESNNLLLTVSPQYLDQKNYAYRFCADTEGRIDRLKEAWWEPVVDSNGVTISRRSRGTVMILMRIPIEYKQEDDRLKMQQYNATIDAEANSDVPGFETDTDRGRKSALQSGFSSDPNGY